MIKFDHNNKRECCSRQAPSTLLKLYQIFGVFVL